MRGKPQDSVLSAKHTIERERDSRGLNAHATTALVKNYRNDVRQNWRRDYWSAGYCVQCKGRHLPDAIREIRMIAAHLVADFGLVATEIEAFKQGCSCVQPSAKLAFGTAE